ncbi:MAG: nucleotidyl transferase AbiEii/AbiGii toxin family protein [Bacteroidales bacterium]|jgi:predicted nucleotidyltransferase component of viral defense system|nr:nucleotidyl transferase AbiEii/AbiGii toxin family protein [Bacteroidales bacterium]MCK9455950.1 nucleotidyl transferase AbiEii/AbiGii toxin family protein [Candidatus Riflebacteria bacterium]MDY0174168.1 nucleotidyl transferase AbiEii/AbiGii toxin family protein [Bacteroidales bacterium]
MNVFDQMVARYGIEENKRNATYEVMQEIILAGLYRGGFFNKAAFYGGTCLRIFHGMKRFSEDMDFSLITPDVGFNLENYFSSIIHEFQAAGKEVVLSKKDKENTAVFDLEFRTEKTIKIKIEVDVDPPMKFDTEQKLLLLPYSFMTRCFVLPDLFAGKIHALVYRKWKHRVKGRDWYDFEWYIRKGIKLNFNHLQERIKQFNGIEMNRKQFIDTLKGRLADTDIELVRKDVLPFIQNPEELEIWSTDYFLQLADRMEFQN